MNEIVVRGITRWPYNTGALSRTAASRDAGLQHDSTTGSSITSSIVLDYFVKSAGRRSKAVVDATLAPSRLPPNTFFVRQLSVATRRSANNWKTSERDYR